jgi:hypothetical protein
MGSPVQSDSGGIKLKPENMEVDRLYHCIHEGKVFLFYKDEQDILHCYEVEDLSALEEISENPDCIEKILRKYAGCD